MRIKFTSFVHSPFFLLLPLSHPFVVTHTMCSLLQLSRGLGEVVGPNCKRLQDPVLRLAAYIQDIQAFFYRALQVYEQVTEYELYYVKYQQQVAEYELYYVKYQQQVAEYELYYVKYQQQVAEYERNMTKYQKAVCESVKSAGSGLTLLQYLQMPFC